MKSISPDTFFPILILIYMMIGVITFGHASHNKHFDEPRPPIAVLSAFFWPFYWSYEFQYVGEK